MQVRGDIVRTTNHPWLACLHGGGGGGGAGGGMVSFCFRYFFIFQPTH